MSASPTSFVQRFIPLRMPRVCVAVTGSDPAELMEKAEGLVRDNAFLEFRLDYLSRPAMALPKIKRFYEMFPHAVVIATCRRVASGGKFRGAIASQLDVLAKAAAAGCQLVDVELQTALKCKPEQIQKLRTRAALILSFHDFHATQKAGRNSREDAEDSGRLLQGGVYGDDFVRQRRDDEISGERE